MSKEKNPKSNRGAFLTGAAAITATVLGAAPAKAYGRISLVGKFRNREDDVLKRMQETAVAQTIRNSKSRNEGLDDGEIGQIIETYQDKLLSKIEDVQNHEINRALLGVATLGGLGAGVGLVASKLLTPSKQDEPAQNTDESAQNHDGSRNVLTTGVILAGAAAGSIAGLDIGANTDMKISVRGLAVTPDAAIKAVIDDPGSGEISEKVIRTIIGDYNNSLAEQAAALKKNHRR